MRRTVGITCLVSLLAAGLALLNGCFGISQNPSYFPYLMPTEDIVRTHAKPPGLGYFSNFDPHAAHLIVRPLEATNPVRTQHVLIATVTDEKDQPRRSRRVEWILEGVGNIIEVDESGFFPGRGYKVDNHYAVSYTEYVEHTLHRNLGHAEEDIVIKPGQTWCVISSAVEGDSHVTIYAPEIANWDCHKVFVTKHWVDAAWMWPDDAVNPAGTQHVFTTTILRNTDRRQPLANYRVRYRILPGGPPAVLLPDRSQEYVAVSDLNGHASVTLAEVAPAAGVNRLVVEIIRPPDPTTPSGVGMVIARKEVTKEWLAPSISLNKTGPASAGVGQEIPYTISVTNTGKLDTRALTVHDIVPEGLLYVRSQPPALEDHDQLVWTLGTLPSQQTRTMEVVFRSTRAGPITNHAKVVTEEGLTDEKSVTTQITVPQIKVVKTGPSTGVIGSPITYQIAVTNPGAAPATNVVLLDKFDPGLEHESKPPESVIRLDVGTVLPGQTKTVPLVLTPRRPGALVNRVDATADGGLADHSEHVVQVADAKIACQENRANLALQGSAS